MLELQHLILWTLVLSRSFPIVKAFACPNGDEVPASYTRASSYAPTTLFYRKEFGAAFYSASKIDCESNSAAGKSSLAMFRNDQEYADVKTLRGTEIFGFTGIVFNGIPGLTEYF